MDIFMELHIETICFIDKATSYKPEHLGLLTICTAYL